MAILIPALGACTSRMTSGERRLAERLEQKLDDDYLLWYDVPVGPQQLHPDFIVLHPSRGLLILEVKDFRLGTIVQASKDEWSILDNASAPAHSTDLGSCMVGNTTTRHTCCYAARPGPRWSAGATRPGVSTRDAVAQLRWTRGPARQFS